MDALEGIARKTGNTTSTFRAVRDARPQAAVRSREEASASASAEVEISREARARQALVRRSTAAAVTSAAALPPRSADATESRSEPASKAARPDPSERAAQGARREDRDEERSREKERQGDPEPSSGPVLAVRVGVPPIGQIGRAAPPTAAEAALRERAVLRDLGQVLSLPTTEKREIERAARKAESDSAADAPTPEEVVLIGAGRDEPDAPRPERAREPERAPVTTTRSPGFAARDPRAPRPVPQPPFELPQAERRLVELRTPGSLGGSDLREVSSVIGGSGAGGVRDPNEAARQIPLPGSGSQEQEGAIEAQRATTQFSVVEAQASDELVTRFLGSSRPRDPGPEPRFRQPLE